MAIVERTASGLHLFIQATNRFCCFYTDSFLLQIIHEFSFFFLVILSGNAELNSWPLHIRNGQCHTMYFNCSNVCICKMKCLHYRLILKLT